MLIRCMECGNEVSDKAESCPKCGYPINNSEYIPIQKPVQQQQTPQPPNIQYTVKKKETTLSIVACIMGLLTITSFIGFILGLIDICKNDKTRSHKGSIFAIIMFILVMFMLRFSSCGESSNVKQSDTVYKQQEFETTNEKVATTSDSEIEYLKHEVHGDDLVVYMKFTNKSSDNMTYCFSYSTKAFQNGVELESLLLSDINEFENKYKEIQPNTEITVAEVYKNVDSGTVDLEITELFLTKKLINLKLDVKK